MGKFIHLIFIISSLLLAPYTLAHHSFSATFQENAKITREGVVTKFSFRNPHVLVYFDVTNDDGSITNWVSEGGAATLMRRRGWSKDSITPGDTIRVFGDSTHDGSPMTSIDSIDIIDPQSREVLTALVEQEGQGQENRPARGQQNNTVVKAAPMPLRLPNGQINLSGAWTNHGMANGRPVPPNISFSDAGQAVQDAFVLANDPQVFCDPPGLVRQAGFTPHPIRITQLEDRVVFEYEEFGGYREVFFDDRAHVGYNTHLGDSIAYYEGDSLVVETTNLLENQASPDGDSLSTQTTTKEVYSRDDNDTYGPIVLLTFYATDPLYTTEMVVMTRQKMSTGANYDFIENDCHAPLREREVVNSAMNFFATNRPSDSGSSDDLNNYCASLAAQVGQGGKNWQATTELTSNSGEPWYTAQGELLLPDFSNLNLDSGHTKQIKLVDYLAKSVDPSDGLLYCLASN